MVLGETPPQRDSKPGGSSGSVVRESPDSFDESWDWQLGTTQQIIQLPIVQIQKLSFRIGDVVVKEEPIRSPPTSPHPRAKRKLVNES